MQRAWAPSDAAQAATFAAWPPAPVRVLARTSSPWASGCSSRTITSSITSPSVASFTGAIVPWIRKKWAGPGVKTGVIAWRRANRLQQQLARAPLLASVGTGDLRRLAAEGRERRYAEGETVIHEGCVGGAFFIVLEGAACVSIGGVIVRTVSTGDVFGEVAVLQGVPRSASVVSGHRSRLSPADLLEPRRLPCRA